jgi:methyl-accepting chemotaxis protein
MRLSLRNRFLVPTLALIIISLGISTAVSYYEADGALSTSVEQQMRQICTSVVDSLDAWFKDRKLDVSTRSQEPMYQAALADGPEAQKSRDAVSKVLTEIKQAYGYYEDLCLADTSGNLLSASNQKILGKIKVGDRDYFKGAMTGKVAVSSKVVRSRATGNPIFVVAAPVKVQGRIKGVLFGVVDVASFSKRFIDKVVIGKTGYAYIFQNDSVVIAHPKKTHILKTKINSFDWGQDLINLGDGLMTYTYKGVEKLVASARMPELGWTVVAGASTDELTATARELGWINLAIAGRGSGGRPGGLLAGSQHRDRVAPHHRRPYRRFGPGGRRLGTDGFILPGTGPGIQRAGRLPGGDLLLPGGDGLHDPPERGQRQPGRLPDAGDQPGGGPGRRLHERAYPVHGR